VVGLAALGHRVLGQGLVEVLDLDRAELCQLHLADLAAEVQANDAAIVVECAFSQLAGLDLVDPVKQVVFQCLLARGHDAASLIGLDELAHVALGIFECAVDVLLVAPAFAGLGVEAHAHSYLVVLICASSNGTCHRGMPPWKKVRLPKY
jgi:hypothetical protein